VTKRDPEDLDLEPDLEVEVEWSVHSASSKTTPNTT
jgi:hypothetical protein